MQRWILLATIRKKLQSHNENGMFSRQTGGLYCVPGLDSSTGSTIMYWCYPMQCSRYEFSCYCKHVIVIQFQSFKQNKLTSAQHLVHQQQSRMMAHHYHGWVESSLELCWAQSCCSLCWQLCVCWEGRGLTHNTNCKTTFISHVYSITFFMWVTLNMTFCCVCL